MTNVILDMILLRPGELAFARGIDKRVLITNHINLLPIFPVIGIDMPNLVKIPIPLHDLLLKILVTFDTSIHGGNTISCAGGMHIDSYRTTL